MEGGGHCTLARVGQLGHFLVVGENLAPRCAQTGDHKRARVCRESTATARVRNDDAARPSGAGPWLCTYVPSPSCDRDVLFTAA